MSKKPTASYGAFMGIFTLENELQQATGFQTNFR